MRWVSHVREDCVNGCDGAQSAAGAGLAACLRGVSGGGVALGRPSGWCGGSGSPEVSSPLVTDSVSEFPQPPRVLQETRVQFSCGGDQITATGAGGGSLAYSVLHSDEVDPGMECQFGLPGDRQATGGAIWVVSGQKPHPRRAGRCAPIRPGHHCRRPGCSGSLLPAVACGPPSRSRRGCRDLERRIRDPRGDDQSHGPHRRHRLQWARARRGRRCAER